MKKNHKGLFVVLEGGEGVGKSTNLEFIQNYLKNNGITFQASREPGGTELAEKIRQLILDKHNEPVADLTELLLMFAARAQHLQQKIIPALEQGDWMVCDRFTDATYAYQGGGRQLSKAIIVELEQLVQGDLRPDCVILLDAPVNVGRARAQARAELDRMESEAESFHQRVREAYLSRASQNSDCYAVVDASRNLEQVQDDITEVLKSLIIKWKAS